MLPRATLLFVALLVMGAPLSAATTPDCASHPSKDQTLALKNGVYLVVSGPATPGFWTETNHVDNLQGHACGGAHFAIYDADHYDGLVFPADQLL